MQIDQPPPGPDGHRAPAGTPGSGSLTVQGLRATTSWLAEALGRLEVDCLAAEDATALLHGFEELARVCAAGRLVAARRAASCHVWQRAGHASPGQWLSEETGVPVGEAERQLATAELLEQLPEVEGALRRGELSAAQAEQVAGGAAADPAAQEELLRAARGGGTSFRELQGRCRQLRRRAASAAEDAERAERQRRNRRASFGTDDELMGTLHLVLPPAELGRVKGMVDAETERLFQEARREGRRDPLAAYRADAVVALLTRGAGAGAGPGGRRLSTRMLVRADITALARGHVTGGEICDLPGVGPVPVATARELLGESLLTVVLTKGVEVTGICSAGRHVPAAVHLALMWRDPHCVVPGCDRSDGLERHHWRRDYGKGGPTALDNLARLCRHHHDQATNEGYRLDGGPGRWAWIAPPALEDDVPEPTGPPGAAAGTPAAPVPAGAGGPADRLFDPG